MASNNNTISCSVNWSSNALAHIITKHVYLVVRDGPVYSTDDLYTSGGVNKSLWQSSTVDLAAEPVAPVPTYDLPKWVGMEKTKCSKDCDVRVLFGNISMLICSCENQTQGITFAKCYSSCCPTLNVTKEPYYGLGNEFGCNTGKKCTTSSSDEPFTPVGAWMLLCIGPSCAYVGMCL